MLDAVPYFGPVSVPGIVLGRRLRGLRWFSCFGRCGEELAGGLRGQGRLPERLSPGETQRAQGTDGGEAFELVGAEAGAAGEIVDVAEGAAPFARRDDRLRRRLAQTFDVAQPEPTRPCGGRVDSRQPPVGALIRVGSRS